MTRKIQNEDKKNSFKYIHNWSNATITSTFHTRLKSRLPLYFVFFSFPFLLFVCFIYFFFFLARSSSIWFTEIHLVRVQFNTTQKKKHQIAIHITKTIKQIRRKLNREKKRMNEKKNKKESAGSYLFTCSRPYS